MDNICIKKDRIAPTDEVLYSLDREITTFGVMNNFFSWCIIKRDDVVVTDNYDITFKIGTLNILKRVIYISVDSYSILYGEDLKSITLTYAIIGKVGFVNQEDQKSVTISREPGSDPGKYLITLETKNINYELKYDPGEFIIRRKDIISDPNSSSLVSMTAVNGIGPDLVLMAEEKESKIYEDVKIFKLLGGNKQIKQVFDLNLRNSDDVFVQPDNDITIKILLNESLKEDHELSLIYINTENIAQVIDSTRDADYIVFTTPHLSTYAIVGARIPGWGLLIIVIFVILIIAILIYVSIELVFSKLNNRKPFQKCLKCLLKRKTIKTSQTIEEENTKDTYELKEYDADKTLSEKQEIVIASSFKAVNNLQQPLTPQDSQELDKQEIAKESNSEASNIELKSLTPEDSQVSDKQEIVIISDFEAPNNQEQPINFQNTQESDKSLEEAE